jgi:MYND finger
VKEIRRICGQYPWKYHLECSYCGKGEEKCQSLTFCGRCGATLYCSKECQQEDWYEHKLGCIVTDHSAKPKEISTSERFLDKYLPLITVITYLEYERNKLMNKSTLDNVHLVLGPPGSPAEMARAFSPHKSPSLAPEFAGLRLVHFMARF